MSANVKLRSLENKEGIFIEFKAKSASNKATSKKFLNKVKGTNTNFSKNASNENIKKLYLKVLLLEIKEQKILSF
ncbi:Vsp/OspC family lipoprotein [Borreliella tanukii]|uniref:Vsp/OspC family lipoprotein n=1 Tax=Borreliella tanukii TaxID=56146 RepID=UPI003AB94302